MIGNFRSRRKSLLARALKNHEIAFGASAFQRRIQRPHHRCVENIQRRPVEGDPRRAIFEPQVNRFVAVSHDRRRIDSGRLLSLKLRWPLFEKRSNSFIAIIGQVATNLLAHFVVERLRKFLLLARKKRLLHRADRQRRPLRDFLRQRFHSRFELGDRNDLIYQAERKRRFRIDHVTRVKKFGSFGWSNKSRQEISSAVIGKQSNLCEILSEGRFFRGNANVRSERNVHSRTGCSSVQWALVSCSLPMRATSCASFLKCRTFSLLPVAFAPLVEGRTYTRAP